MAASLDKIDPTGLTTAERLGLLGEKGTMYPDGGAGAYNDAALVTKVARDWNPQLGDEYTDGFTIAATKVRTGLNGERVIGLEGAKGWRNDQAGGILGNNLDGRDGLIQEGVIISRAERGFYEIPDESGFPVKFKVQGADITIKNVVRADGSVEDNVQIDLTASTDTEGVLVESKSSLDCVGSDDLFQLDEYLAAAAQTGTRVVWLVKCASGPFQSGAASLASEYRVNFDLLNVDTGALIMHA